MWVRTAFQLPVSRVIFDGRPGAAFTLPALSTPVSPRLLVSINTFCRILRLLHFSKIILPYLSLYVKQSVTNGYSLESRIDIRLIMPQQLAIPGGKRVDHAILRADVEDVANQDGSIRAGSGDGIVPEQGAIAFAQGIEGHLVLQAVTAGDVDDAVGELRAASGDISLILPERFAITAAHGIDIAVVGEVGVDVFGAIDDAVIDDEPACEAIRAVVQFVMPERCAIAGAQGVQFGQYLLVRYCSTGRFHYL